MQADLVVLAPKSYFIKFVQADLMGLVPEPSSDTENRMEDNLEFILSSLDPKLSWSMRSPVTT